MSSIKLLNSIEQHRGLENSCIIVCRIQSYDSAVAIEEEDKPTYRNNNNEVKVTPFF
jgi:hypothetical protein